MTEAIPGRPYHLWTLSDIKQILDGIRYVNSISKRDVYKWCADRILEKYGYVDLLSLHHKFVAFKDEQHHLMVRAREYKRVRREFNRRDKLRNDKGLYTMISRYDGQHDDRL